jgi:hemolysin activation/secretion protein
LIETQQKPGIPLSTGALDRGLLLADDLPGVSVAGALKAGDSERETDLVLKFSNDAAVIGEIAADNYGSRSTGRSRLTANLNINSPFGKGDLLIADAIVTEGSEYLRLSATLPIGSDGWRTGINGSALSYKLITPEFAALNARGWSNTLGAEATYPIIRSRFRNLYFSANIDQRSYENEFLGITSSRYSANALTLGLTGNTFDKLAGGGATSAALAFVSGSINLDGSPNQQADANTTRTAGNFQKIRYSASRQQTLSNRLVGFAGISGQWAGKNLDSSEKFYLGGASGVRAYPTGEGGGTLGNLLNLELRWRLKQEFTLTGFYDYGSISINSDNNFTGAPDLNSYSLKGAGFSLAWQSGNTSLKAAWSHRIGDNPNPTITGTDQDGSLIKNRYWLLAVLRF